MNPRDAILLRMEADSRASMSVIAMLRQLTEEANEELGLEARIDHPPANRAGVHAP